MTDEAAHLIVEQLKLLRGDVHEVRDEQQKTNVRLGVVEEAIHELRDEQQKTNVRLDQTNTRLDVVETTLRDFAQQLVILARGVHTLLQNRRDVEGDIDDLKRRVAALEGRG